MMKKIFPDKKLVPLMEGGRRTMMREPVPVSVADEIRDIMESLPNTGAAHPDILCHARHHVGDILAVAQSYKDCGYLYEGLGFDAGWTNRACTKAEFMPLKIEITGIGVERLRDISDDDCIKEGVRHIFSQVPTYEFDGEFFGIPQAAYRRLLEKCCRDRSAWDDNPIVFVYEYRLLKS